jgi:hypothetical protein
MIFSLRSRNSRKTAEKQPKNAYATPFYAERIAPGSVIVDPHFKTIV